MLTWPDVRKVVILDHRGDPDHDRLRPTHERSLKRALQALLTREEVVRFGYRGQADPFRYTTAEAFASVVKDKKITDRAEAKWVIAETKKMVGRGLKG